MIQLHQWLPPQQLRLPFVAHLAAGKRVAALGGGSALPPPTWLDTEHPLREPGAGAVRFPVFTSSSNSSTCSEVAGFA